MTELKERVQARDASMNGAGRAEALASLKKKRDFHTHLLAYVLVNGTLWAIWAIVAASQGSLFPWPIFPLLGWGIGLAFHAWDAYARTPFTEAQIDRELRRLQRRG